MTPGACGAFPIARWPVAGGTAARIANASQGLGSRSPCSPRPGVHAVVRVDRDLPPGRPGGWGGASKPGRTGLAPRFVVGDAAARMHSHGRLSPPPPRWRLAASAPTATGVTDEQLTELLAVAVEAAEAGASVVWAAVDKPRAISYKGQTDLVTLTDVAAEAAVLARIRQTYPGHLVLGEEGGVTGEPGSPFLWCVDPVDGTTNFAHSYAPFAVSVAVLHRGTPVAAAVVEFCGGPLCWSTRTYTAALGRGASVRGSGGESRTLAIMGAANLRQSLLVTGFGYDHGPIWAKNLELFKHFTDVTQGVRRAGAASVDFCHVALGVLDGYWEYSLKPWDVAAGVLVVTEAGGVVTRADGGRFSVFGRSVLAANSALHGQILEQTRPATMGLEAAGHDLGKALVPGGYDDAS